MPDRDVKIVQDIIYYQYAKVIEKSAFSATNGKVAKKQHYGFAKKIFLELQDQISILKNVF